MSAHERPTFVIQLRPEKGTDPIRALKALLKTALRRHRLRCVSCVELVPTETQIKDPST